LRNDEAKVAVLRITGELAGFAETTIADAGSWSTPVGS
jgi:hypothetical protein